MFIIFFFNDTATTEIYTLSLHDALPIFGMLAWGKSFIVRWMGPHYADSYLVLVLLVVGVTVSLWQGPRSEEHTSELQSQSNLVCRLLLEKKKKNACSMYR